MALNSDELSFLSSVTVNAHCKMNTCILSHQYYPFFKRRFFLVDPGSAYLCLVADFGYFDAIFNCPSIALQLWHVPSCDVAGGLYRRFGRVGGGEMDSNNMGCW